ncbi:MAG: GatB/YqeY domain-containing protein [Microcystaceae cyanobacterium]
MLNTKQVDQLLSKTIKKVISSKGISLGTRKGNKELGLLTKKIAKHPFATSEDVISYGEKVGEAITTLLKQKGKENLDLGVIRQVSFSSPEITELDKTHPISKAKTSGSSKVEVIVPPKDSAPKVKLDAVETGTETVKDTIETAQEETENKVIEVVEEVTEAASEAVETAKEEVSNNESQLTPLSLKDQIGEDIKAAMKAKDKVKLATVRAIKKAILEKEVELRPSGQEILTPEQELSLLSQQAKQRRDSIEQYKKGGREDLVEQETKELAIIETYLPPQLSEEEVETIVTQIIADVGATSPKEMGKVMGVAMKELKGKTDGKKVQAIVQSKLK